MNSKDLYRAINGADGDILERSEAAANGRKRKSGWLKWGAMAACLCLVITGTVIWKLSTTSHNQGTGDPVSENGETISKDTGITVSENGVTIPKMKVTLSANEAADMLAFFIYQGRCYVAYEWIYDNADMVGEYLGTATGLIDEWTPEEGYVELAGSIGGDFYAVKGYDPSFMLCMKADDAVDIFICNNGITLKYGSELYEDRLHLSDNIGTVQYESHDSWDFSRGERYQMNSVNDIVLDFIREMDSALFVPYDSVPLDEGKTHIAETELYHLYFRMENGTTVHLRLAENGYVRFQGIWTVCVQVPEETYSALLSVLDSHTDSAPVEVD